MPTFSVATVFSAIDHLSATFDKWNKKGDSFESGQKKNFKEASKAALGFKQVFEGTLAAKGVELGLEKLKELPEAIEAFAEKGERIGRVSKIVGMTADQYQRLQYAAHMMDLDSNVLDSTFKKMNVNLGMLKTNQGQLFTSLIRVNPALMIQLRSAKSTSDAFLMTADVISKTTNAQQRAAIATAVFGRAGQELIPTLMLGRDGLKKYMSEADKFGSVISGKAINASENFSDSLKKTRGMLTNIKENVLSGLLVKLQPIIEKMVDWVAANKDLITSKIETIIKKIGDAISFAYKFAKDFGPAIMAAVVAFYALKAATIAFSVISGIIKAAQLVMFAFTAVTQGAATAQEALNLVMDANPVGLVIAAVAALVGLTVLLIKHWNDANGVFVVVKKTIMSLLTVAFFPLIMAIDTVMRGIELFEKMTGKDTSGIAKARAGMEGFIYQNTFLSGMKNGPQPAPNAAGLAASKVNLQNHINVDNTRAPGTTSTVRSAPSFSQEGGPAAAYAN